VATSPAGLVGIPKGLPLELREDTLSVEPAST
jgi:hypothetical protein